MKKLLILILAFIPLLAVSQFTRPYCGLGVELKDCTARETTDTELYSLMGDVRIVKNPNEDATFNIFVTKGAADMVVFVEKDKNTFFDCGIWRWTDKNENFSVRFVDNPDNAHFSVRFVESLSDGYGCHVCDE